MILTYRQFGYVIEYDFIGFFIGLGHLLSDLTFANVNNVIMRINIVKNRFKKKVQILTNLTFQLNSILQEAFRFKGNKSSCFVSVICNSKLKY